MGTNGPFDLRLVTQYFSSALRKKDDGEMDVNLADYADGYNQLNKLFYAMGRLFSFIADDVTAKTRILAERRRSDIGAKYEFVGGMMAYEKEETRLLEKDYRPGKDELPNGSRTLLRLHRALLFASKLLEGIRTSDEDAKLAPLTKKAYDETLAQFHPWAIQKMVHVVVHTLPSRKKLVPMLAGTVPQNQVGKELQAALSAIQSVYDVVQGFYEHYGLLNLP